MSTNFQRGVSYAKQRPASVAKKQEGASVQGKKSDKHVCERIRGPYLARHLGGMVLWATILFLQGAGFVGKFFFIHAIVINQQRRKIRFVRNLSSINCSIDKNLRAMILALQLDVNSSACISYN